MYYYEVAPIKIVRANQGTYTYHSDAELHIGQLVLVPIGKQELVGLVMSRCDRPLYKTKPLSTLDIQAIPQALVATADWMSKYYSTHLSTVLQTVLPRGITKKRRVTQVVNHLSERKRTNFVLNQQQQIAVNSLLSMAPGSAILHGITGSGKTAVYIEIVRYCLQQGTSAVVLVPEIALTSQLVAEFQNHFEDVLVTHSGQTEAERHNLWTAALRSAKPLVVIGPRSALFMPLKHIGVIIVDEAHEPSYRQDQSPKYSALRVASVLAMQHKGRVIQGTATPLICEYYLAHSSKRPVVTLPSKARQDATEPFVTVIDMTKKPSFSKHRFLSDVLLEQMSAALEKKEQILIFHNRRGSASTTLCDNCGWSAMCQQCFIPLTLHADSHQLVCHICAKKSAVPTSCPECRYTNVVHRGIGTKLIESELSKLYPKANIARFDGDSHSESTLAKNYQAVYDGNVDIIIGTQIVAKGLDLPHLRVVGVVQADAGLSLPDYTASERTFQLLSQVIGRVGRSSHPTSVVIQSYQPNHPAVQFGIAQDYGGFYEHTLAERRRSKFPPYAFLLKLTCLYKTEQAAVRNATKLANTLMREAPYLTILGPVPAFYEHQLGSYRWQLVVKSSSRRHLLNLLEYVPSQHWQIDLDPSSLL